MAGQKPARGRLRELFIDVVANVSDLLPRVKKAPAQQPSPPRPPRAASRVGRPPSRKLTETGTRHRLTKVLAGLAGQRAPKPTEGEPRHRLTEVLVGLATVMTLLGVEWALYGEKRSGEDAADIVTLCGFGGLAAAGLRLGMPRGGQALASLALGLIGGLAAFHGARKGADAGMAAGLVGVAGTGDELGPWFHADRAVHGVAFSVAMAVAAAAFCIQRMVDVPLVTRSRLVVAMVVGLVVAAAVVGLTANGDILTSVLSTVFITAAFLAVVVYFAVAFRDLLRPVAPEPSAPAPSERDTRVKLPPHWRVYAVPVLLTVLVPLMLRAIQVWSLEAAR